MSSSLVVDLRGFFELCTVCKVISYHFHQVHSLYSTGILISMVLRKRIRSFHLSPYGIYSPVTNQFDVRDVPMRTSIGVKDDHRPQQLVELEWEQSPLVP